MRQRTIALVGSVAGTVLFASACSVFELLRLGAAKGTAVEIVADGPDEESALQALCELFGGGAGI